MAFLVPKLLDLRPLLVCDAKPGDSCALAQRGIHNVLSFLIHAGVLRMRLVGPLRLM